MPQTLWTRLRSKFGTRYWQVDVSASKYLQHEIDTAHEEDAWEPRLWLMSVETREYLKRARRVHVSPSDIQPLANNETIWKEYDGERFMSDPTLTRFKAMVCDAEYQHKKRNREGYEVLVKCFGCCRCSRCNRFGMLPSRKIASSDGHALSATPTDERRQRREPWEDVRGLTVRTRRRCVVEADLHFVECSLEIGNRDCPHGSGALVAHDPALFAFDDAVQTAATIEPPKSAWASVVKSALDVSSSNMNTF